MSEDDHVHDDGGNESTDGNQGRDQVKSLTDLLLQSPSALEALGRGLLPTLSPWMSQHSGQPSTSHSRNQVSSPQVSSPPRPNHYLPNVHSIPQPWCAPYPCYGPPSYGQPPYTGPYPMMGGSSSGPQDRSNYGSTRQSRSSLPGNPGCAPRTSCSQETGGLLASETNSLVDDQEVEDSWQCLVDPFLSPEERNSLDPDNSEQGDQDGDDVTDSGEDLPEELTEFLSVAFKKPVSADRRRKLVTKYPRPTMAQTTPPSIDKSMLSLIQKRKSIIAHDRFLSKLQRFASDSIGPLIYLLRELQSGKGVPKEKAVQAIQTALCFTGNTFATLSIERRRSILRQLNQQLTPMAEEEFDNNGKLFGDDFGKRAKERTDAIRSLSKSSSVFFRLGDPPTQNRFKGQGGRGKGPANRFTPYKSKGQKWGKANPQQGRSDSRK